MRSASGDTLGMAYYKGRELGYDYFRVQRNMGHGDYRIAVPNGVVKTPMPYTSNPRSWRVCGPLDADGWLPPMLQVPADSQPIGNRAAQ